MLIVKIDAVDNLHYFEFQSGRNECWLDGYVEVPKSLEHNLITSQGYCDLVIEDGLLKNIIPRLEYMPVEIESNEVITLNEINAMLVDQEYRLTMLEAGVNK